MVGMPIYGENHLNIFPGTSLAGNRGIGTVLVVKMVTLGYLTLTYAMTLPNLLIVLIAGPDIRSASKHGVQRRMISLVFVFVILRLLFFALLLLYVT